MPTVAYTRLPQRFFYRGISLGPADALGEGKLPYASNIRSYQDGTIGPRDGLTVITNPALGAAIHSIARLNDPTTFAPAAAMRYLGSGADLLARAPSAGVGAFSVIDTGYSGDPLSFVAASPVRSPQPWLYIGDRSRSRKVNTGNVDVPIGIAQPSAPTTEPAITLGAPGVTVISDLNVAGDWTQVGAIAAAPSNVAAVNTTIAAIVYDGGTTGYASIAPTAFTNIHVGQRLGLAAAAETVLVTDVLPAISTTTIAAIIYDAGTSGLCTIQPVASLGAGQLEGPNIRSYVARTTSQLTPNVAASPTAGLTEAPRIRRIDFPVNCLVTINSGGGSAETIRILSVAVGQDGVQSFRCSTANTHAAGESLTGVACFRAFTTAMRAAGNTITGDVVQQVLTPTSVAPVVGGIQDTTLPLDLSLVGGRAVQPEDELLLSVKVDTLSAVEEIRIYLDVNAASTNFLDNYFFFAWRANDILSAIHATNTWVPTSVQDARQNVILQNQIDQPVVDPMMGMDPATYRQEELLSYGLPEFKNELIAARRAEQTARATALSAGSGQLAIGNNQWIALTVKIRDLIRVGADLSRTLANVGGVEIMLTMAGTTAAATVQYDSALIQGGFGPDVGDTGDPYVYAYRYRSSTTGAKSNLSPPSRGGVVPRRQRVTGTATASGDAQADLVDWFRRGGQLTRWTYVMTATALTDDSLDSAIEGGDGPGVSFQPWPTSDLPRSGTGTVAGTALTRTGGDTFNTSWAPGTTITVNGITTTLYASPTSTTLLHLTTNVGSGTGIAWSIKEPLLLSQNLPAIWGGAVANVVFLFGCGDPTDPGALRWSNGNDPDGTSDANWLSVSTASAPLQHGCVYDGVPFVFSTEQLYRIEPTFGQINTFRAQETACGEGLWSRWAFAVAPEGIYFLKKDGIALTAFGSPAVSITDPDISDLFPHDGAAGRTVNGIVPPDMTQTTRLRLSIVDRYLYFDYRNTSGQDRTLVYDRATKGWTPDLYPSGIYSRLSEPGAQVEDHILGAANGHLYQMSAGVFSDNGTAIPWVAYTTWPDGGDPRIEKFYGDVLLDYNMQGATQNLSVVPVYNDAVSALAALTFGAATTGRRQTMLDLQSGAGVLARNLGLQITGSSVAADTGRPLLYLWEPAFVPKVDQSELRPTDWDAAGYPGVKQVRGVIIKANTLNVAKPFQIERDGGTVAVAGLTVTSNGEIATAYAFPPFYAHLLRIRPTSEIPWLLFQESIQWICDPKPELTAQATDWENGGIIGDKYITGVVLHVDTGGVAGVQVQVQTDNSVVAATLTLAATTGEDGQPFSFTPPIYAEVMRLIPLGAVRILGAKWLAVPKPELIAEYTDWTNAGHVGAKFMQGIVVHVDTGGVQRQIEVQYDNGAVGATLTIPATTGEDGLAFSFPTPFIAHVLRIRPIGALRLLKVEWKWEPTPEFALRWEAQATSFDLPGFLTVRDAVIAYNAPAAVTLSIQYDDQAAQTYTLPATTGYDRTYVVMRAGKGRSVVPILTSSQPFQVFQRDCVIRVGGWGIPSGYIQTAPFGGAHRAVGAQI